MAIYDDQWFEVWYSEGGGVSPLHLLIVKTDPENRSRILILDPAAKGKVVYVADDYEDATNWLCEDEYSRIEGREFPDDGW